QEYIASELGINQNTYSKLESGQTKLTIDRVKKLAELYNVDPDYFLSEDAPIINYNSGSKSRSIINTQNYNDNQDAKALHKLYEKLLSEKDQQIDLLKSELQEVREDRKQMKELIDKLLKKVKDL
ncbi:MAG: helix-turn-helix transcriptional regulator, partial [Sediminibacterium sp.]|nr:helix-turn-helix transcriptional regulator [Sediminibacterium sp.]